MVCRGSYSSHIPYNKKDCSDNVITSHEEEEMEILMQLKYMEQVIMKTQEEIMDLTHRKEVQNHRQRVPFH